MQGGMREQNEERTVGRNKKKKAGGILLVFIVR